MTDIIVRIVPNYGFLPIIMVDGKEVYRGEFQSTHKAAFDRAVARLDVIAAIMPGVEHNYG